MTKIADLIRKSQNGPEIIEAPYRIAKVAKTDERLVTGQVYAPDTLDAHGHFMTKDELQQVAHRFMLDGLLTSIDIQHDNETVQASIVESFIARKGDPDFEEGSWVATVKIDDLAIWERVKNGELNGYSFEILTYRDDMVVAVEYQTWYYGFTDPDPHDNHTHPFLVRLDASGEIVWGQTGPGSNGEPIHSIQHSNITAKADGHTHRIHFKAQE